MKLCPRCGEAIDAAIDALPARMSQPVYNRDALEAAVAAERKRCRDLVRRYMPAGWSAVYDAISDAQHAAGTKG